MLARWSEGLLVVKTAGLVIVVKRSDPVPKAAVLVSPDLADGTASTA
jgi:hypothetical protein